MPIVNKSFDELVAQLVGGGVEIFLRPVLVVPAVSVAEGRFCRARTGRASTAMAADGRRFAGCRVS